MISPALLPDRRPGTAEPPGAASTRATQVRADGM